MFMDVLKPEFEVQCLCDIYHCLFIFAVIESAISSARFILCLLENFLFFPTAFFGFQLTIICCNHFFELTI